MISNGGDKKMSTRSKRVNITVSDEIIQFYQELSDEMGGEDGINIS